MKRIRHLLLLAVVVSLGLTPVALGQDEESPALGVARVSLTNGDITMRRGDSGDWVQARVNMPLVEGDSIAAGPASRAEVQLDYSNLLRLNEDTEVHVVELGNRRFRIQVERGLVTYNELRGGEADVDIETSLVVVRPLKRGLYRVQVFDDRQVIVTVRRGEAEVASSQGTETLKRGKAMIVRGDPEGAEFRLVKAEPKDDWDRWNERRDEILCKSESYRYLSRDITGGEDLDRHGHWRYVSGYGHCWFPTVSVGWAPYRHGRWMWLDYYGWSWVGYEPWGWAPYHYGRWFYRASYGWGWYPGYRYHRHYWRPALVAFFGYNRYSGFNFNVGVGFGGFRHYGWIPLAPRDPYYPWYGRRFYRGGHFRGGRNTIYVDNSINIYNTYRNARHHNGVTVVDADGFSRGLVNNPRALRGTELRRATLMRGQIPVVPGRASLGRVVRASNNRSNATIGPNSVRRTAFFSRNRTGRVAARTPFDRQREQISTSVRSFRDSQQRRAGGTIRGGVRGNNGQPAAASGRGISSGGVRSSTASGAAGERRVPRSGVRGGSSASTVRTPAAQSGTSSSSSVRGRTATRGFPRARGSSPGSGVRSASGSASAAGGARDRPPAQNSVSPSGGAATTQRDASQWRRFGRSGASAPANRATSRRGSATAARGGVRGSSSASPGTTTRQSPSAGGPSSGRSRTRDSSRARTPRANQTVGSPQSNRGSTPSREGRTSRSSGVWRQFGRTGNSPGQSATSSRPSRVPSSAGSRVERSSGSQRTPRTSSRRGDVSSRSTATRSSSPRTSRSTSSGRLGRFVPRSGSRVPDAGRSSRSSGLSGRISGSSSRSSGRATAPRSSVPRSSARRSAPRSSGGSRAPSVSRRPSVRSGGSRGSFSRGSSRSSIARSRAGSSSRGGSSVSRGGSGSRGGSASRGSASRSSGGGVRSSGGRGRR